MEAVYRKRTTETAITLTEEYYPVWRKPGTRSKKCRPTNEAQQFLNDKNSERHFADIVANNFRQYEDLKVELTYSDAHKPEDLTAARAEHVKFIRRLRRWYDRHGIELKYVVVDEIGKNGTMRPHHHMMLTGGIDYKTLKRIWGNGAVNVSPVDYDTYGVGSWASYVYKDSRYSKKWRGSKNLTPPKVRERDSERNRKASAKLQNASIAAIAVLHPDLVLKSVDIKVNPYNKDIYVRLYWIKPEKGRPK